MISFKKYILPLILLNITISANGWNIIGFSLGQILYWVLILLIYYELYKYRYHSIINWLYILLIIVKSLSLILNLEFISIIGELIAGVIFILAGIIIFGQNRDLLQNQLLTYFILSIPFLIIQKIGVHTIFYAWNTEMFHANDIYDFDLKVETGKLFKSISLYNTLFTSKADLTYVMYQARPTGLSYSNNVLSVILVVSLALSLFMKNSKLKLVSSIVLPIIVVLLMSTLVYTICLITFLFYKKNFFFNINLIFCLIVHLFFFPGLTESSFGIINMISFISRFGEIFQLLGYSDFLDLSNVLIASDSPINIDFNDKGYSLFGQALRFEYWYLFIPLLLFIIYYFIRKLRKVTKIRNFDSRPYITLFLFLFLTQFAIPFIKAPFFQLFFGVSLFPFFNVNKLSIKYC